MKSRRNLRQILMAAAGLTLLFSLSGCGTLFGDPRDINDPSKSWAVAGGVQFYPEDKETLENRRKFFFGSVDGSDSDQQINSNFSKRYGTEYTKRLIECMNHQSADPEDSKAAKAALVKAKQALKDAQAAAIEPDEKVRTSKMNTARKNALAAAAAAVKAAGKAVEAKKTASKNANKDANKASVAAKSALDVKPKVPETGDTATEKAWDDAYKSANKFVQAKIDAENKAIYVKTAEKKYTKAVEKNNKLVSSKEYTVRVATDAVSIAQYAVNAASVDGNGSNEDYITKKFCETTTIRNDIIYGKMEVIDDQFYIFLRKLHIRNNAWNITLDTVKIILNGLATTVGGTTTKSALSAASAGIVSLDGSVNEDVFYDKTLPVIIAQMIVNREKKKEEIKKKLSKDLNEYTLSMANMDLKDLVYQGSFSASIITLQGLVSKNSTKVTGSMSTKTITVPIPAGTTTKTTKYACTLNTTTYTASGCSQMQ